MGLMETIVLVALAAPVGVAAALWFDGWCERRWNSRWEQAPYEPPSNLDAWDGRGRDELLP